MRDAAVKLGLPGDAIICLTNSTIEGTETLMKHRKTAVILATGGTGLVRAAYSSGKPAFGVGPGNVPVFIERSANVEKAVSDILTSTCFDNGTICASEQSVVVDAPVAAQVREQFKRRAAIFLIRPRRMRSRKILLTPQRTLNAGDRRQIGEVHCRPRGHLDSGRHAMPAGGLRRRRARLSVVDREAFADACFLCR